MQKPTSCLLAEIVEHPHLGTPPTILISARMSLGLQGRVGCLHACTSMLQGKHGWCERHGNAAKGESVVCLLGWNAVLSGGHRQAGSKLLLTCLSQTGALLVDVPIACYALWQTAGIPRDAVHLLQGQEAAGAPVPDGRVT